MNTSMKMMEWLTSFSIVQCYDAYYLKSLKTLMNLVHFQKQLGCYQHMLSKIMFY